MEKIGVLLINLGTPDSCRPKDVRKYLVEFLTDGRVIDFSWLKRQLLVRCLIVPKRYKNSAKNYARIWSKEGSPLKIYGEKVKVLLQDSLGPDFQVELAMRYQSPSIPEVMNRMKDCSKLVVIPLFPHYASATTGSAHQKVMEVLREWINIPELRLIGSYPVQSEMIDAFCDRAAPFDLKNYDHVLFSFHGLPERQIKKADCDHHCLKVKDCCSLKNKKCYGAESYATAEAIASKLGITPSQYTVCFQSRLGNEAWLRPYTSETLEHLIAKGKKRVLVFSPAFVCDCLETIDEIANEYRSEFLAMGGISLDLVPGLNDHPLWIEALKKLTLAPLSP